MAYTVEELLNNIEILENQLRKEYHGQNISIQTLKNSLLQDNSDKNDFLHEIIIKTFRDNTKYDPDDIINHIDNDIMYQELIITKIANTIENYVRELCSLFKHILNKLKTKPNHSLFIYQSILNILNDMYSKLHLEDYLNSLIIMMSFINTLSNNTINSIISFVHRLKSAEIDLKLNLLASESNKIVFIGKNGSGKSQYSRTLITQENQNQINIIPAVKEISLYMMYSVQPFNKIQSDYTTISSDPKLFPTINANKASHLAIALNCVLAKTVDFHEMQKNNTSNDIKTPTQEVETLFNKILKNKKKLHLYDRDNHPKVTDTASGDTYYIQNMSDGEKTILYLISCVVLSPKNSIIIADEPGVHLHNSIQNTLWDELEKYIDEQESTIIYITHDVDFMTSRQDASFYLFNSYNPKTKKVDLKHIKNISGIPDKLFFELAPLTQPIIFCEGGEAKSSEKGKSKHIDKNLYEVIFHDAKIVECGSCDNVIARTQALNSDDSIKSKVFGIIDKDDRDVKEIKELKKQNIYAIPVACVENLYLDIEFIKAIIDTPVMISEKTCKQLDHKTNKYPENKKQEIYLDDYVTKMISYFNETNTADNYIDYHMHKYTQKMTFTDKTKPWNNKIIAKIKDFQDIYDKNLSLIQKSETLEEKYNKYLELYRHHNLSVIAEFCGINTNKKDLEFEGKFIRLLKTAPNFQAPLNSVRQKLKEHFDCKALNDLMDDNSISS